MKIVGEPFNKESLAVLAKKKNKYIGRINEAIQSVSKDGTYKDLYTKWFTSKPEMMPNKIKKEVERDLEHET